MTNDERGREVQAELEAATEAVAEHGRRQDRAARATQAEEGAREAVTRAQARLVDETADVRRLESYSTTRIWAALRGRRDTDLDRERAEQEAAEYAVARAESWWRQARDERDRAARELADMGDPAARRGRALAAKEEWLRASDPRLDSDLTRLANDLASCRAELKEVLEAAWAAAGAEARLAEARRMLGAAGDWATYDTFLGGGVFGDAMKYDRMDKAQRLLHDADLSLRRLAMELDDTGIRAVVEGLSVGELTRTFDVWFDNVFSDWSVRSRIQEASRGADAAAATVHRVKQQLAAREQELTAREKELVAERERVLLAADPTAGR